MRRMVFAGLATLSLMSCKGKGEDYTYRPREDAQAPLPWRRPALPLPSSEPPSTGGPTKMENPKTEGPEPSALNSGTDPGCKEGMARVGSFCIDRFEVSLIDPEGKRFKRNNHPPEHMNGLKAISTPGTNPQGHLSGEQAAKACIASGKRLCTSDEWEKACRGPNSNAFPYGPAAVAGICNVDKRDPHILDSHFPDIPHLERKGTEFNDPLLLLDPAYQTRSGQMAGCVTMHGVYDMDGNMSEWVSDTTEKEGKTFGTFRGAPFSGHANEGCARKTTTHEAKYYDYSTGTRCCASLQR